MCWADGRFVMRQEYFPLLINGAKVPKARPEVSVDGSAMKSVLGQEWTPSGHNSVDGLSDTREAWEADSERWDLQIGTIKGSEITLRREGPPSDLFHWWEGVELKVQRGLSAPLIILQTGVFKQVPDKQAVFTRVTHLRQCCYGTACRVGQEKIWTNLYSTFANNDARLVAKHRGWEFPMGDFYPEKGTFRDLHTHTLMLVPRSAPRHATAI